MCTGCSTARDLVPISAMPKIAVLSCVGSTFVATRTATQLNLHAACEKEATTPVPKAQM